MQGSLEVLATDFLGGAAPGLTLSGTLLRGKKAAADKPLAFSAARGGAYTADATDLGLTPGVYTCAPCKTFPAQYIVYHFFWYACHLC